MKSNPQSGNAVIWALIAIALFAALSATIMSGSRTSTAIMSNEEARSYAKQIIAYGNDLQATIQRLKLRGCDPTEISFENSYDANYTNPNAPPNKKCHVFDRNGGNIEWNQSNILINGPYFMGITEITGLGDASTSELIFFAEVNQSICEEINTLLGGTATPEDDAVSGTAYTVNAAKFKGTYTDSTGVIADSSSWRAGKNAACILRGDYDSGFSVADQYQYYHALLIR